MSKKKHLVPVVIFLLAGLISLLGIWQILLYMSTQLAMIKDAGTQGATAEQISEYYWQQYIPQIFTYIITTLGFSTVLFAIGMLHIKLGKTKSVADTSQKQQTSRKIAESDDDLDDFYDEYEIVNEENENN